MTHNIFWWNCKHIEVDNNLGVAFCTKNNDFCNKSKCTEIQGNPKKQYYRERVEELQNENEQLKETIKELELENAKHIGDGEWDIRDITYGHGKFRLEEWGERYHQFYNGDKQLEDEEVVSLLFENEQLKKKILEEIDLEVAYVNETYSDYSTTDANVQDIVDKLNNQEERIKELEKENRGLQFKIIDMLDFVKEKGTVTREEIKKWWNGGMAEKRYIINNSILIDNVTKETFDNIEEVVDILNHYEETCLQYEKTISELKKGNYKEPLPITQRK